MKGICKLYDIETDLCQSHIYPKFSVEYLKETGSRFLRTATEPNIRKQDTFKPYLLSNRAEQEFSKREKWFAENIFTQYLNHDKRSFKYDENLFYFTISFFVEDFGRSA